jgi:TusA-related sulfurtransferase
VLEAAAALRARPHVRHVELLSTDPLSVVDVPVYAMRQGFEVVERTREGTTIRFVLERRAAPARDGTG